MLVIVSAGKREPSQSLGEQRHKNQCKPEVRDRLEYCGYRDNEAVELSSVLPTSSNAHNLLQDEGQNRGNANQTDCPRKCVLDDFQNRGWEVGHRDTPVSGENVFKVRNVLVPKRLTVTLTQHGFYSSSRVRLYRAL